MWSDESFSEDGFCAVWARLFGGCEKADQIRAMRVLSDSLGVPVFECCDGSMAYTGDRVLFVAIEPEWSRLAKMNPQLAMHVFWELYSRGNVRDRKSMTLHLQGSEMSDRKDGAA